MNPTPEETRKEQAEAAADVVASTAVDAAAALKELAAQEAQGLTTAASLAKGQKDIADGIRASRTRELVLLSAFLISILVFGTWSFNNSTTAKDAKKSADAATAAAATALQVGQDIIAARSESRVGLCRFLVDMRIAHNHYVQTTINERQQIIDGIRASGGSEDSVTFFLAQIESYKTDILPIPNCDVPAELETLFKK